MTRRRLPNEEVARGRVVVESVRPAVDGGRFAVKRTLGESLAVSADIFVEGHDLVAGFLLWRREGAEHWRRIPMESLGNDEFRAGFASEELGRHEYRVVGVVDRWASARHAVVQRHDAGLDVAVEVEILARLVDEALARAESDGRLLRGAARALRAGDRAVLDDERVHDAMLRNGAPRDNVRSETFPLDVDRVVARFSSWYELFPRSLGAGRAHGTFRDAAALLPEIAAMGFDVLYLPPVHPIGGANRKGADNALVAKRDDPGSPWAVGSADGGHMAVHPQLGTVADFRGLVEEAARHGLEVALDIAFQCAPDHPYLTEHPDWFRTRPDGTIQHAENPPKRYEDIVPFDFETEDWRGLWRELRAVFEFWVDQGVRIFRVDNPHTKPFAFWEWLVADLRRQHPDVVLLSEAFTRPRVLQRLAKIGFNQSYTYFAWRNHAWELRQYFEELTQGPVREYLRPNVWPNTPDILTEYLQSGGRPAFAIRAVLATTLAASYGIYGPAFELSVSTPRTPGSEEYLASEKYEIKEWDRARADSLRPLLTRLNGIRRAHPALQSNVGLRFHDTDNPELLCYSKVDQATGDVVVVVVTVDAFQPQSGFVQLDLAELGLTTQTPFLVRDELGGEVFTWHGPRNFVALDAGGLVAHVLTPEPVRPIAATESVSHGDRTRVIGRDPHWYRDAIIYQVHVRAFQDSDDNGIGDFDGLTARLDYLQELGVTALWLLPFYPSPLRDDGYDIADYCNVHPNYGSLPSFRRFLREAHRRDLAVITELVLNHTSDQHPWFRRARLAPPGSNAREYYVWSRTTDRFRGTRIIFRDFESSNWTLDPAAGEYYWHRFYSHQPDLNFENPAVHDEVRGVFDFWVHEGVDGFRLDAVPYLYEAEGTQCENLPATHRFLKALRSYVDRKSPGVMFLAEANQWPDDAAAYFGTGDECHMAFNFPVMPRLFMALKMEDRFPIVDILEQTPEIPDSCQWAIFLRNHDELTLEMVTDEERDYMYRVYAGDPQMRVNQGIRRRLAPLLQNDRRRIELLNGLLFSMPGTPIIYYGDEIGMGDNVWLGDRNAVRTPMQWSADKNAGFSRAHPQSLYLPVIIDPEYHYEHLNVEAQLDQPASLLRWMRQMIAMRRRHPVLARGALRVLHPENPHVLAFVREDGDQHLLVVANLSRRAQAVEVDLGPWVGATPVELLGTTSFPSIGTLPYLFTLGPYAFHAFELVNRSIDAPVVSAPPASGLPRLVLQRGEQPVKGRARAALARLLAGYIESKRWFAGKTRGIESVRIAEVVPLPGGTRTEPVWLLLVDVELRDGSISTYVLPLAVARGERAARLAAELAHGVVAEIDGGGSDPVVLYEALWNESVAAAILDRFRRGRVIPGERGSLEFVRGPSGARLLHTDEPLDPHVLRADQSNTSVAFGTTMLLKLYRRVDPGVSPEFELGTYLDDHFGHVAPVGGALRYVPRRGEPSTLALLSGFVRHECDAWQLVVSDVRRALEDLPGDLTGHLPPRGSAMTWAAETPPDDVASAIGRTLDHAALLGRRSAEMHVSLAAADDPDLAPESFTMLQRRALHQSFRVMARQTLRLVRRARGSLAEPDRHLADEILEHEERALARYRELLERPLTVSLIRAHGDYHLGQVLFTGLDFVIVDFEGEPARSLEERRRKRPALRDVAGMVRSFDYAVTVARREVEMARGEAAHLEALAGLADSWAGWCAAAFLRGYRDVAVQDSAVLPADDEEATMLLDVFLLDKAFYELSYELGSRPEWAPIPLRGLHRLLAAAS